MAGRENYPPLDLEVNVPVIVKPWRLRSVTTKYGDKLMLVVKDGEALNEIQWLPVDAANDLVALGALDIGRWENGDIKYSIKKGAPDIAICKRQKAGDKYPHYEIALADEDAGPEMPAPTSAPTPTADSPADVLGQCMADAIGMVKAARAELSGPQERNDPAVIAACIQSAHALAATLFIQRSRS